MLRVHRFLCQALVQIGKKRLAVMCMVGQFRRTQHIPNHVVLLPCLASRLLLCVMQGLVPIFRRQLAVCQRRQVFTHFQFLVHALTCFSVPSTSFLPRAATNVCRCGFPTRGAHAPKLPPAHGRCATAPCQSGRPWR